MSILNIYKLSNIYWKENRKIKQIKYIKRKFNGLNITLKTL